MEINFQKYHFAPEYIPLFNDKNPTKLLYGSRNSAKSDFACFLKVKRCLTLPYFKCLMIRKFKADVRMSIYDTLKKVIERYGLSELFEFIDGKCEITCKLNGNKFIPLGVYESGGKTDNAKSISDPTDAIFDELDQCTEDEYESMFLSLRGSEDLESIGIFNTNKVDEEHWIFKRWFPPRETFEKLDGSHTYVRSKRKYTTILHTTYLMNPFVNKTIVDEFNQQKEVSRDRYEVSGLGLIKYQKQSGMALPSFDRSTHVSESVKFKKDALVYLSCDFNRIPHHTIGVWQFGDYDADRDEYSCKLVNEFCLKDTSVKDVTIQICQWLKKNTYEGNKVAIACDYYGNSKTDHDSKTHVNQLKTQLKIANFDVIDRTIVNPSVLSSLDFLNEIFSGAVKLSRSNEKYPNATLSIKINPICKFHIADYEKTKTKDDGTLLKVKKSETLIEEGEKVKRSYEARGHAVDGSRYIMVSVFKNEYSQYKSSRVN